jgi:hypothetical protein
MMPEKRRAMKPRFRLPGGSAEVGPPSATGQRAESSPVADPGPGSSRANGNHAVTRQRARKTVPTGTRISVRAPPAVRTE